MLVLYPAEPVVSIVSLNLLDHLVGLKVELLCFIADVVIYLNEIVKLTDIALVTILRIFFSSLE